MNNRLKVIAVVTGVLLAVGCTGAVASSSSGPVQCDITDNTLTCPLPPPPAPVTETVTSTATTTVTAPAGPETLFADATPANPSDPDDVKVELGVKFKPAVDGVISGVRFFKGPGNTGTHTGSLWSGTTRVATVTFANESESGWQQAKFATPIIVKAGTEYIASYLAPAGHYAGDGAYPWPKVSGNLTGLGSLYKYDGGLPTETFNNSNYYVDVLFVATGDPVPPPTTTAPTIAPTSVSTSSSTTSPPVTTTAPPSSGWPGAGNTGVPAGVSLTPAGSMTITQAGAVIDAREINGTVQINANNVTLKRSRITGSGYAIVRVQDGRTGVRIEDVEINGRGRSGTGGAGGVVGPATVLRANIYGVENGFVPHSGSVIQDSWIHGLDSPGDPHYDGIQMDGDMSDVMVDHNVVDLSGLGQTGAIMVDNYFGDITHITVQNSKLLGGGWTVYCDGKFQSKTITGVTFKDNRIAGGLWGPLMIRNCNATVTGNVNDATGAPL